MFSTGQLYVALSRCTSLAGLVLKRPVLPKDLKVDRRIARFLRASADPERSRRFCAIGLLTVGDEGRMSRPRPVELAVAFDDGTAVSTLINPSVTWPTPGRRTGSEWQMCCWRPRCGRRGQ